MIFKIFFAFYIENFSVEWISVEIDFTSKIPINFKIQELFWQNPIFPSNEFIVEFASGFKNGFNHTEFNRYFQIPSCKEKDLLHFPELKKQVQLCPQRSQEWFALRKKYPPNGNIKENSYQKYEASETWVVDLFHLIVGAIGELTAMFGIQWSDIFPGYTFVTIGLIVTKNGESLSPDGFLLKIL